MNEVDWLNCPEPFRMVSHVTRFLDGLTCRKLRMYCVGCIELRNQYSLVDRYNQADLEEYETQGIGLGRDGKHDDSGWARMWCNEGVNTPPLETRADLLREVFGNPFRPVELPVVRRKCEHCKGEGRRHIGGGFKDDCGICKDGYITENCSWLTWNDGIVSRIAERIYQERAWGLMPQLHDALLDAGCDSEAILCHLRGMEVCPRCEGRGTYHWTPSLSGKPQSIDCSTCKGKARVPLRGPHVRGCWVIDLLTGRE